MDSDIDLAAIERRFGILYPLNAVRDWMDGGTFSPQVRSEVAILVRRIGEEAASSEIRYIWGDYQPFAAGAEEVAPDFLTALEDE